MLAIVAAIHRDIAGFLRLGRFRESDREGGLRFFDSASLPHVTVATGGFDEDEDASRDLAALLARCDPRIIVPAGFASAARPALPPGEIILCDRVMAVDGPVYSWRRSEAREIETNPSLVEEITRQMTGSDADFQVGACLTLPQPVLKPPMKEWLGKTFDTSVTDLDGYPLAAAIQERRLPLLPVKAVMNTMERDISPRLFETMRYPIGRRILRSTGYVAANPLRTFEVAKLSAQAGAARKSLARFLYRLSRTQLAMGQD